MLKILCSSVRVRLLTRAKLIFLREQPDDFFFCVEPCMVYLLLLLYCGALVGCPDVSKSKTLNSGNTSVVFFSCFVKFKCLGDVLDSVAPITVCHIEVRSFGCFYIIGTHSNNVLIWFAKQILGTVLLYPYNVCPKWLSLTSFQIRQNA